MKGEPVAPHHARRICLGYRPLQPGRLQSLAEFWQALGGKPKATLSYTVTIGVEPGIAVEAGPPVTEKVFRFREGV